VSRLKIPVPTDLLSIVYGVYGADPVWSEEKRAARASENPSALEGVGNRLVDGKGWRRRRVTGYPLWLRGQIETMRRERRCAQHARYNRSEKGTARTRRYSNGPARRESNRRYNRTLKRLTAQRERNQVRREGASRREILTLAGGQK
jgi:hypothetical protein